MATRSSEGSAYPPTSPSTTAHTTEPACRQPEPPATVWKHLAPLIAARPRVRESRDGGRTYHARWERPLTDRLPAVPAAVPLYSAAGDTRTLVIDLDASRGGRDAVLRDATALTTLIRRSGGAVITDESPSGGIHLYLPLRQPVPFHDARDVALALAARTPTMDPTPNTNLLHGLIRPPGSVHKTGGHQTLRGSLTAAHHLARTGNPPSVWQALTAVLAEDIQAITHQHTHQPVDDQAAYLRPGGPRELTSDYLRIATSGLYDAARYRSPSEARQAVITSAAWAGMTLPEIIGRIQRGAWPGLAALYARYRPTTRAKAITADWRKATALVARERANPTVVRTVHKSPTSALTSHRRGVDHDHERSARGTPSEYRFLRTWWNALALGEHGRYCGRSAPAIRMVLRALGEAGMKAGSRYIAFGTRAVAVATGLDHTTVADHLRTLRAEPDPLIALIEDDRGIQADLYELRIPDSESTAALARPWRKGRLHALRPAFRALGLPAAYVYEALEHTTSPATSFELSQRTHLGRSTVYAALETLAAYHLAERRDGRWNLVATTSLALLAEQLGCLEEIADQLAHHREERRSFHAALGVITRHNPAVLAAWQPQPWLDPPPDIDDTVLDLLQRELGARVIA